MIKGIAGAKGAGRIPKSRAAQGVSSPMITPLAVPTQIAASARKKLTKGPVKKAGSRNPCNTNVSARKIAVRVRNLTFTGINNPPHRFKRCLHP